MPEDTKGLFFILKSIEKGWFVEGHDNRIEERCECRFLRDVDRKNNVDHTSSVDISMHSHTSMNGVLLNENLIMTYEID